MVYWLNSRNVDRSMVIFSLSFYYQCLAIRPRFVSKLVIYIESKLPLVFSWYFQNRVKSLPLGKKKKKNDFSTSTFGRLLFSEAYSMSNFMRDFGRWYGCFGCFDITSN